MIETKQPVDLFAMPAKPTRQLSAGDARHQTSATHNRRCDAPATDGPGLASPGQRLGGEMMRKNPEPAPFTPFTLAVPESRVVHSPV
jgi:hypothetical protein